MNRRAVYARKLKDMLGVNSDTLAAWRRNNCGPRYYTNEIDGFGSRAFYFMSDVEAWLESLDFQPAKKERGKNV